MNRGDAFGDIYLQIEGLQGSCYADTLSGDGQANRLEGGAGNDSLSGRDGDDTLTGGAGDDLLAGGIGADSFIFTEGEDTITDFTDDTDTIHVSAGLWQGAQPDVAALLAEAEVTATGVVLHFGGGATLDIRGIFDASLLADDILVV